MLWREKQRFVYYGTCFACHVNAVATLSQPLYQQLSLCHFESYLLLVSVGSLL